MKQYFLKKLEDMMGKKSKKKLNFKEHLRCIEYFLNRNMFEISEIQEGLDKNCYVFYLLHQFKENEVYFIYRWIFNSGGNYFYITSTNIFDYNTGTMYKASDLSQKQYNDLRKLIVEMCLERIVADKLEGIVYPELLKEQDTIIEEKTWQKTYPEAFTLKLGML